MALKLGLGRGVHDEHAAVRARAPGGQGNALRGIAGADGPDAPREVRRRQQADGVARAPDLERSNRLKRLELEIHLGGVGSVGSRTSGVRRTTS